MVTVGERLRAERERLGLTQEALADAVSVTKKSQGMYERGLRSPNAEYLAGLAALGADALFVLTGQRTPAQPALDEQARALLDNYGHLDKEDQDAISRLAYSLAKLERAKERTA